MARSQNEIIVDLATNILREQGNADIMPGEVLRDISMNSNALEMANIYNQIENISTAQSIANANFMTAQQLDNLLGNFGIQRRGATKSIGTVRFYTTALPTQQVIIPENTLLSSTSSTSGKSVNFITRSTQIFDPANANLITDGGTFYAIDVDIIAEVAGVNGNVGAYTITTTRSLNLPFQVTNPTPTVGGVSQESNNDFATRALSIIVGSNAGTENGYRGLALTQDNILDALIIGPGDDLMVRDGGFGGKVDIWTVPSAAGTESLTSQSTGGSSLSFSWNNGQQFNNGYKFIFPLRPLDASSPVTITASTAPSGSQTNVLLYESRTPAPSAVAYMDPSGTGYHYTVFKANDLDTAQSIYANDYIIWNGPEIEYLRTYNPAAPPSFTGNSLSINIAYSYTSSVAQLQTTLDSQDTKIITADVLAKEAQRVFIDTTMDVQLLAPYKINLATERSTLGLVRAAIAGTINNISLGNTVQESDLVQSAHNVPGVDNVILNSVSLVQRYPAFFDQAEETVVDTQALSNQYFTAGNIIVRSV